MTAPTEPLVTSLEEALRRLHENGRWLEPSMVGDGWVVHYWNDVTDEVEIHGAGATWPEAVSIALGRPVVARDSAADLEAELSKWRSALQCVQLHTCDAGNGWLYSHSWTVNGSPNVSGVVGTGSYPFPRPGRFLAHSEDEALREAASDALDSLIEKTVGFPRSMRTWLEGYCGARVTSDTYQPTLFGGSP